MDVTELHDEENLLVQMQDRWENYGSLDAIVDTHDPFTLEGAPRFELSEKIDSLLSHALTEDENLLLRQTLGMGCKQRSVKSLAKQMGITQKTVQKKLVTIVEKLRHHDDSLYLRDERAKSAIEALKLPDHIVPLCAIIIGHPAENPEPKDKWLPENVSYNEFGGKAE